MVLFTPSRIFLLRTMRSLYEKCGGIGEVMALERDDDVPHYFIGSFNFSQGELQQSHRYTIPRAHSCTTLATDSQMPGHF